MKQGELDCQACGKILSVNAMYSVDACCEACQLALDAAEQINEASGPDRRVRRILGRNVSVVVSVTTLGKRIVTVEKRARVGSIPTHIQGSLLPAQVCA
jgi:hypothetical protein